jgi:hypothetical protein
MCKPTSSQGPISRKQTGRTGMCRKVVCPSTDTTSRRLRRASSASPAPHKRETSRKQFGRAIVAVAVAVLSTAGAASAASSRAPIAWPSRTLVANDEAHLHMVSESGSNLVEEGQATGTLPGRVRVGFTIGAEVRATFTIYPRGGSGSLSGKGSGTLHSSGRYASFGGSMTVTAGTGRYRQARGSGGFYGVIDRKTYALVVQTRGTLHY